MKYNQTASDWQRVDRRLVVWLLLGAVLVGCLDSGLLPPEPEQPAVTEADSTNLPEWLEVYFSDPSGPGARSLRGGPDAALAQAIEQSRISVDMAAMDLDLWSLRDALIAAHRRGVPVQLVVESEYLDTAEIRELIDAGVPVLGDRREGLMHNKFVVVDGIEVWTGSMNFTLNGAYRNDNNLLRVRSAQVAENYSHEFEEMFGSDQFGPGSPADTPHPHVTLDGVPLEVYFSPDDGTQIRLVELVQSARQQVRVLAYAFTDDDLAAALIERQRAGIEVRCVLDAGQAESNQGGEYANLRAAGMDVRRDGNPDRMHHKLLIIDGQIVVTGSYNFSRNAAEINDENTLIIFNAALAQQYLIEFERVYAQARP